MLVVVIKKSLQKDNEISVITYCQKPLSDRDYALGSYETAAVLYRC